MENGLQNGLKCFLRDKDLKKIHGRFFGSPSNERGGQPPLILSPTRGLRRSVQAFDFRCPPPPPPPPPRKQPLRVQP